MFSSPSLHFLSFDGPHCKLFHRKKKLAFSLEAIHRAVCFPFYFNFPTQRYLHLWDHSSRPASSSHARCAPSRRALFYTGPNLCAMLLLDRFTLSTDLILPPFLLYCFKGSDGRATGGLNAIHHLALTE